MRLWIKQTLVALAVMLLTVSLCLYYFVIQETNRLLDRLAAEGAKDAAVFCEHLNTLELTGNISSDADAVTRSSMIQFTFATYAHLLQSGEQFYSLVADEGYLYNISSYQPMALLPMDENTVTAHVLVEADGVPLLISAQNVTLLQTPVTVYVMRSAQETFAHIETLTHTAQLALGACLLLGAMLLAVMMRRSLSPLRKLTRVSEQIAGGQYALRSDIRATDEVGDLSRSFDHMAETVEQKILDLEDTARRRELLLGALTHEMKTPMTAIIGFSDSLLTMPLTEEGRMQASYEIHEAALRTERLSQKMMQLIAMNDCPVLVRRALRTDALLTTVRSAVSVHLEEKQLTLLTTAHTDTLVGDSDLLISLLTNLIDNAAKASTPGKTIRVTAEETEGAYRLAVSDEGSGIPADKIALVTEPFYRVDKARSRKQGGAGLGLSLCQMIAQAHGGTLNIQSTEGQGTTIAMTWPKEEKA